MIKIIVLLLNLVGAAWAQNVPQVAIADPVTHQWVNVANGAMTVSGTVTGVGNSSGAAGQQSVTGSAVALATFAAKQVCINALSTNSISIFVGFSGSLTISNGFELKAGAGVCLPLANVNLLFVIASTTGAGVSWLATN